MLLKLTSLLQLLEEKDILQMTTQNETLTHAPSHCHHISLYNVNPSCGGLV